MTFEMPEENTASILVAKKVSRPNLQFKVLPKIMQALTLIAQGLSSSFEILSNLFNTLQYG